jgi:N-acyl-D-aspartate/D-glutamate deacylase
LILAVALLFATGAVAQEQYDIVIRGGRVIDPETALDAVRDVGIRAGTIARVSEQPLHAARVIDAKGMVVAPGFIDLHQHGQTPEDYRLKALDGVTTALELEIGASDVHGFLDARKNGTLINFGTSASHPAARAAAFGAPMALSELLPPAGHATDDHATPAQLEAMQRRLRSELDAGALGVGMGINYTPGATREEIVNMFRVAAERAVPVFVHIRSAGRQEPGSSIESVGEVIAASAVTGAPLHIVHLNSMCLSDVAECLRMVEGARARGLDVTTEAYPYIAGMTQLNSALFNPGWREKMSMNYSDIMIPSTGERLTKERFDELHASPKPLFVVLFNNRQEFVDTVLAHPVVIVASDGAQGHPRNAGTYARFVSQYVRERRTVSLMEAMRKMSYMPAVRLERSTPAARNKGRLQAGADADIVVFDPQTFADRATFQQPNLPSVGVQYLLVGGVPVVDRGNLVPNVTPGRAIVGYGKER